MKIPNMYREINGDIYVLDKTASFAYYTDGGTKPMLVYKNTRTKFSHYYDMSVIAEALERGLVTVIDPDTLSELEQAMLGLDKE